MGSYTEPLTEKRGSAMTRVGRVFSQLLRLFPHGVRRQLGVFDATMLVMGGIVGSGIFMNPSVVARQVHTPFLILGVWVAGGALALLGAFIWAELATRLPGAGGQYLYLRKAYHPAVAFVYGWVLLLVTQTGGMAAVAVTFARYYREISGVTWSDSAIAAAVLLSLSAINCLGARAGSNVQSALMLLKMGAIAAMVVAGMALGGGTIHALPLLDRPVSLGLLGAIGAAMIPVGFAYGGWQTSTFVAGGVGHPGGGLSRRVGGGGAGGGGGERGAWWIAMGIAISTLGFLSQGMLTAPRVYHAMARDGLFFESVGRLSARTGAPVTAIVLQGIAATATAFSGKYEQILNYEVSVDFIAFALAAGALFLFRRQERGGGRIYRAPGHPYTTALFVAACVGIVASTVITDPLNSARGWGIMLTGVPVYWYWSRRRGAR